MAKVKSSKATKKAKKRVVHVGTVHINSTFNNTIITFTDLHGNTLGFCSCGTHFKGSRKSTPYAAQVAGKQVAVAIRDTFSMREVNVRVKGPGSGRESAMRAIGEIIKIVTITDVTGIPHNGCRAEKERRV